MRLHGLQLPWDDNPRQASYSALTTRARCLNNVTCSLGVLCTVADVVLTARVQPGAPVADSRPEAGGWGG